MRCDEYLVFSSLPRCLCAFRLNTSHTQNIVETMHDKMKQYGKYGEMFQIRYTPPLFKKKQRQREKEKKVLISGLHERKTFSIHKIMNISWWYQHLFILMLELMSSRVSALSDVRVYYILHIVYWRCALLLFNSSFSIPFYLLYAFCLSISLFDGSKAVMVV